MKRTIEFFLSLTGSLLGVVASILALGIAYLDLFFHLIRYFEMTSDLLVGAWGSLIFSCVGFTASIVVLFKPRLSSVLLFISGIGGLICIDWFYLIPAVLMIISGIMVFVRKEKTAPKSV
ncbi:hypothetical protein HC660_24780 [Bacillus mojavensis]|uniref:DUF4064 domain-containing protein n=1 Tax=Bacillus mojavensis TaxID=72360 RepID=A0ABX6LYU8_BACMO|nr:hypothetical protein [Bacillus mojavensis]QJC96952.1 hypothetical protein HC660_24780 [Bacillus mojavensis]